MNAGKFLEVYTRRLTADVGKNPQDFGYVVAMVPAIAAKMVAAMAKGSANVHDSRAIKGTCKELGIRHTIRAIKEYLNAP